MKKVFLTLSLVAAAFFCQAQLFVGGDLGFSTKGGSTITKFTDNTSKTDKDPKTITFEIIPTVGFMFNENIGIGLDFGYSVTNQKSSVGEGDNKYDRKDSQNNWIVAPYFRWVFGQFDRVSLYADARINFGGGREGKWTKTYANGREESGDGNKVSDFGFNIVPGINFMISDNIALNAKLNLISLGYNMTKTTTIYPENDPSGKKEEVVKNTDFGLGVNYRTALEVGFVYQF